MTFKEWLEATGRNEKYVALLCKLADQPAPRDPTCQKLMDKHAAGEAPEPARKRKTAALDLAALLEEGFVVEVWHDKGTDCREERFGCALSLGREEELTNGFGKTWQEAVLAAKENRT